jgi:hypothetical protein
VNEDEERRKTEAIRLPFGTSTILSLASGRKISRFSDAVRAVLDTPDLSASHGTPGRLTN